MSDRVNPQAVAMTDKLSALRNQTHEVNLLVEDPPASTALNMEDESEINSVLRTADDLMADLSIIVDDIEVIKINHNAILSAFQNTEAQKQNEQKHEEIRKLSHRITDELKKMKVALERDEGGPKRNTADFRIRKAQHTTISRKFRDAMQDYNREVEDYRDRNKEKIQRQLKIAGHQVTEERLDEMLESENPQAFTQNILGSALMQRRQMVSEVEARHLEIRRLEENIRELHDMFYDLAQLVYDQGELVNQIEFNVEHTANYVQRATQLTGEARQYKSKNRRLKWYIFAFVCCVCTVLGVILVAVAGGLIYFFIIRDSVP